MQKDAAQPLNQTGPKYTDCPFYLECLNHAVNQKWNCWTCGKCRKHMLRPVYERRQYIDQYYPMLAEIYPEFKEKYERFMGTNLLRSGEVV